MTLHGKFGPPYAEFGAFLFAPIGDDSRGMPLTVLSALAQLGLEPDAEARRVRELSQEAAMQAVVDWIDALPEGEWTAMDARLIATRLLATLPRGRASEPSSGGAESVLRAPKLTPSRVRRVLIIGMAIIAAYAISRMQSGDSGTIDLGANGTPARTLAAYGATPQPHQPGRVPVLLSHRRL